MNKRSLADAFWYHARQITDRILAEQIVADGRATDGGFKADGSTTPTATRLEGLLASEMLFRDDPAYHGRIASALHGGIRFLVNAQVTSGPYRGGIPRAIAVPDAEGRAAAPFDPRATEIRIDYVQHALGAFVGYRRFLEGPKRH